jgi:DNA-binding LacI/PurR family transcriptional regulator
MVTISDIAQEAGVSVATVSRTFTSPGRLNKTTREQVLAVADRLKYQPRRSTSHRGAPRTDFIGFQFFAFSEDDTLSANAFYAAVLSGAQAEADALGLHLVLHTTHPGQLARGLPKMVRDNAIAGMLLVGLGADNVEIVKSFSSHIPQLVIVDNHDPTAQYDCVLSDGAGGVHAATQHLFETGHRRIGFLLSDQRIRTFRDRLQGYLGAHYEFGQPIDTSLIVAADWMENLEDRLVSYLQSPDRPTALITCNDLAASTVMQICRQIGVDIPGDLSLIGFDGLEFGSHTFPTLSTISIDKEGLGRQAVRRLHSNMTSQNHQPLNFVMPVSLVLRDSSRPLVPPAGV